MLLDSAVYLCSGLLLAGVIHLFLNREKIDKLLVNGGKSAVLKAALIGIPLPLCSCSVLPVADQLRKSGVGPGATAAFLIATPETGVDSILLTYSMMDPMMTVARPIAAFVTALTAGMLIPDSRSLAATPVPVQGCGCDSCGCSAPVAKSGSNLKGKLISLVKYSVSDLLADLAPYLLLGYVLAGAVAALLGGNVGAVPEMLRSGWPAYFGALLIGLPLYVCATSSTPLAAVLWAAGFSPGALLVFLMVGPATNIASLTVVTKILKKGALATYLLTIVTVSILCGVALDALYRLLHISIHFSPVSAGESSSALSIIAAIVLSFGIIYYSLKKAFARFRR